MEDGQLKFNTKAGVHLDEATETWEESKIVEYWVPGADGEKMYFSDNVEREKFITFGKECCPGSSDAPAIRWDLTATVQNGVVTDGTINGTTPKFDEAQHIVDIAFLPRYFSVDIKLTAKGANQDEITQKLDTAEQLLLPDLEPHLYGRDKETLQEVVGRLSKAKGIRIATAESCTGGLIAKLFTDIPGSSDYFERGVVSYSNESKSELLGVSPEQIEEHGAVSEAVAEAMATGMLERSRADVSVSVTGIAGPTGGTEEKPVGLVYIGLADKSGITVCKYRFIHDRQVNRNRAAVVALKLLHDHIKNLDL